jgi:hypothetical protein
MTWRTARLPVTAALLALAFLCGPSARDSADGAPSAPKKDLTLTLRITDKAGGLTLEAKKLVATDTNAIDALRHTVTLTYRTDAGGAPVVTGLRGVTPPKGHAGVASLDGEPYKSVGTGTLTKDALMEWKIEKADSKISIK